MTQIETIALRDLHVPERLRDVDDDHALAIQTSIVQHGLLNPVTVRRTPNAKGGKFTLVAGAHRLRAVELNGENEIDAIVVEADKLGAMLIEIEENLFRNDLSALDRAVFVQTYRDVWERKHGKIRRGGDQTANFSVCPVDVLEENAERGFAVHCAERLGVSKRSIELSSQIAQNLPRDLRQRLRGTPIADNQSALLKLAKLPPEKRARAGQALEQSGGDFRTAMALLSDPAKKPSQRQQSLSRLIDAWGRASRSVRLEFAVAHKKEIEALLKGTAEDDQ